MLSVILIGPWVIWYLVKHYHIYLWGYFWMRLTSESVDWINKIIFPNMGRTHPILWWVEQNKRAKKGRIMVSAWLCLRHCCYAFPLKFWLQLKSLSLLLLRPWNLDRNYIVGLPESLACLLQVLGLSVSIIKRWFMQLWISIYNKSICKKIYLIKICNTPSSIGPISLKNPG